MNTLPFVKYLLIIDKVLMMNQENFFVLPATT